MTVRGIRPAMSVAVVAAESSRPADGIRDYTDRLMTEFAGGGEVSASLHLVRPGRIELDIDRLVEADAILVQYNPFWYGKRGFAPALLSNLWRVRRRGTRPVMAAMVHETFVDMKNPRWALMGAWQRAQLAGLRAACDLLFCSIEAWTERLRGWVPARAVAHLPVASNLPDMSAHRARARRALGASDEQVVLACFGLEHPGRLREHVALSARAVSAQRPVLVVNLGSGPATEGTLGDGAARLVSPGFQPATDVGRLLAASDVFLAPYADGVSTRRTTVMAALQHGIPVVGTSGHLTDSIFARSGHALTLFPVAAVASFAERVAELSLDASARTRQGAAGQDLYRAEFDWPVLTERLKRRLWQA